MIRRDLLKGWIGAFLIPAAVLARPNVAFAQSQNRDVADPWVGKETVTPAAFAKELADSSGGDKPTIVCVGFRNFYESAHIPEASLHGPTSAGDGITDLKQFAQALRRTTNLVIYCGCCPLGHCPNVRPAFTALREMGFTHLRLLALPQSFATDWLKAGYPVEKTL